MFELTISKQQLLPPLLTVAGAVDRKQAVAVLSNILIKLNENQLMLTATDLEIEITARIPCMYTQDSGLVTVPAKKMVDILRSLEDDANPTISCDGHVVTITEGRSRFKLATLPADDFPSSNDEVSDMELNISKATLIHLLQSTHFAMSQQDVRPFLNGLLFELDAQMITTVATDGHRMAISRSSCQEVNRPQRLLLPRKGVQEMLRLLNSIEDDKVTISSSKNQFKMVSGEYAFMTKLVEARFPAYVKAIPKHQDKVVIVDRDLFRRALSRIIILANEKLRAVLLHVQSNQLTLTANNQEQEEGVESLPAQTQGDEIKIGFNASYLLDVLNHLGDGLLRLSMTNPDSSILVESCQDEHYQYVIMPMKL